MPQTARPMHASLPINPNSKLNSINKKWNTERITGLYKKPKFSAIILVKADSDNSKQNSSTEKNQTYKAMNTTTRLLLPSEKNAERNSIALIMR